MRETFQGGEGRFAGLRFSPDGRTLYVAMAGPHQIWKLDLDAREVSLYAGTGREVWSINERFPLWSGALATAVLRAHDGDATDGAATA